MFSGCKCIEGQWKVFDDGVEVGRISELNSSQWGVFHGDERIAMIQIDLERGCWAYCVPGQEDFCGSFRDCVMRAGLDVDAIVSRSHVQIEDIRWDTKRPAYVANGGSWRTAGDGTVVDVLVRGVVFQGGRRLPDEESYVDIVSVPVSLAEELSVGGRVKLLQKGYEFFLRPFACCA